MPVNIIILLSLAIPSCSSSPLFQKKLSCPEIPAHCPSDGQVDGWLGFGLDCLFELETMSV